MLTLLFAAALASPHNDPATDQWPQFLGPGGMATTGEQSVQLGFDLEQDKLWRVELPSGSSSPCIWGDRIFLTAGTEGESLMIALDRKTGAKLWERKRKSTPMEHVLHVDSNAAAPTACTDGERVVFYFGQYGLVVLDHDGELLWEKQLPVPEAPFGIGTSPILVDGKLILSRDGCADSAIYAFDVKDGSELWTVPRLGFTFSFGTPFVWENKLRRELVVAGTQRLTGLDIATGEELWQVTDLTTFVCTTPTADDETLYFGGWSTSDAAPTERTDATWGDVEFSEEESANAEMIIARLDKNGNGTLEYDEFPECRARDAFTLLDGDGDGIVTAEGLSMLVEMPKGPGNNLVVAVKAGGEGDVSKTHVRWKQRRGVPYVSSPALYQGRVYLAKAGGLVTCIDAASGKKLFGPERLEDHSESYATPVCVDGHVILCSARGTISVLRASDEFELVRSVELGEAIHSTPAIVDGVIYLRTGEALWAFGRS